MQDIPDHEYDNDEAFDPVTRDEVEDGNGNDNQAGKPNGGEQPGEYETADSHFPPPPPHWTEFAEKEGDASTGDDDETTTPTIHDPPDISYIFDQGHYDAFGDKWPLKEVPPSLTEMGIQQLYPEGLDRKEALQKLLHTLIFTYIQLIGILIKPPPAIDEHIQEQGSVSEVEQAVMHLRTTSINFHHLLNSLRPIQARETIKLLMKAQIDRRRRRIQELKKESEVNTEVVEKIKEKHSYSFEWLQNVTTGSSTATSESVEPRQESDNARIGDVDKGQMLSEWQTLLSEVAQIE